MQSPLAISHQLETVVVVPCFNEARRFNWPAYDHFLSACSDVGLLLVDDGSTDDTPLVLERLRQAHAHQVCTLRLNANIGKAEAIRRGTHVALRRRPTFIGYWDADLATPLDAVWQFADVLRRRPALQLVMGSRVALLGRQIHRNLWRHLLGRVFATAASVALRLPVYDTQCGAKLFRVTPDMIDVFSRPFATRWVFDVEILARIITGPAGSREGTSVDELIYEIPLERWQDVSGSRLQGHDFIAAIGDLAGIYWRYMRRGARMSATATHVTGQPGVGARARAA
jgi:glycosyltransferase involved in cell wall biosynthesis